MKKDTKSTQIKQIPISHSSRAEYRQLVAFLQQKGFAVTDGLLRLAYGDDRDPKSRIVAVIIDLRDRLLGSSNVTCMACWCACNKGRYPLTAATLLENYEALVERQNAALYDALLKESYRERYGVQGGLFNIPTCKRLEESTTNPACHFLK